MSVDITLRALSECGIAVALVPKFSRVTVTGGVPPLQARDRHAGDADALTELLLLEAFGSTRTPQVRAQIDSVVHERNGVMHFSIIFAG